MMPYYLNKSREGIIEAIAANDGANIALRWSTAYPKTYTNKIAYHIYTSEVSGEDTTKIDSTLFNSSPSFIVLDATCATSITDLIPGQVYWIGVRAVEYDPLVIDTTTLTLIAGNLYQFPKSLLATNITAVDTSIPLVAVDEFPTSGIVRAGVELIRYTSINTTAKKLVLTSSLYRGYLGTTASIHNSDGYDGTLTRSPEIQLYLGTEEKNTKYFEAQCRFDIDHYAYTTVDGYHQRAKDLLYTDLGASDASNVGFPSYDYAGYHRTDPVQLLNGVCVGSYIGGEMNCADGYGNAIGPIRGLSIQDQSSQRLEELLSVTGQPVCLVRKRHTGVMCSCYLPSSEYPDDRCKKCYGSGFIVGWDQYFNPRLSDGRIMVRFGPAEDKVKILDAGLESEVTFDCWTLVVPAVHDRDFIVRFDQDGNEEFRYEILSVTRNTLLESLSGAQKFRVQRVRKTDPIYQVPLYRNTELQPGTITTSIAAGPGFLPHSHAIRVSTDRPIPLNQLNEITSVAQGHSHVIRGGVMLNVENIDHIHTIILP